MTQRQHLYLLSLLLFCFTLCGSIPKFNVGMNYVTWFGVVYLLAAYIRIYPTKLLQDTKKWMWISLGSIFLAFASVIVLYIFAGGTRAYFFISDSNKLFALMIAFSTFVWFKNLKIGYSKIINTIGASTFGIFLIHTAGDSMRQWLWSDTINCVGHYEDMLLYLVAYTILSVLAIFIICFCIDRIRIVLFGFLESKLPI